MTIAKTRFEPGTDDWWLHRLLDQRENDRRRMIPLRDHFAGEPPVRSGDSLQEHSPEQRAWEAFKEASRTNIAQLIVSAPASRMRVRTVRSSTAGDDAADRIVQGVYDASHLADQLPAVFTDMCVYGAGYLLAGVEGLRRLDPWAVAVEPAADRPWEARAAIVLGRDDTAGLEYVDLYRELPDGKIVVRRAVAAAPSPDSWRQLASWEWAGAAKSVPWATTVPVLRALAPGGRGQFEAHKSSLDRLNTLVFNRTVIMTMQAFRQRYLSGNLPQYYPKGHPNEGEEIDYNAIFQYGPAAMIRLPANVELKELQPTDTTQFTAAIQQELKNVAAVTGTPLYMLVPDAVQGSATGAAIARETLVAKTRQLATRAGSVIGEGIAATAAAQGTPVAGRVRIGWEPFESTSLAERAQSASQLAAVLPLKTIWREVFQFTPEQIEQAELDLDDQNLLANNPINN
ncbi:hypothetical protein [Pseudoclavibacter sp. CFCC 13611]|uniref:hypothetical protein n=1 Tax=Pseudoclavibacter sp. CFCC 13611 TaxID=2615178 RepID=UPI001301573D|nr:hypothetical protein [Pseudoclavibacter sp. CFCC 13611]KAB1662764.1 hypothetical protein F8O08_09335 [Pseudoclavibacter sp. CFCC 13611]